MAGRRPKPTQVKRLAGNPGGRRLPENEPQPGGRPTCPPHLDKGAKAEWKRVSKELLKIGLLTSVDRAALAAYCSAYSRWVTAEESIAKFGLVIKSKTGQPQQNPFVFIAEKSVDAMRKFIVEFGMTPSSRSRLSTPAAEMEDPFESFMSRIGATEDDLPLKEVVADEYPG